MLRREEGEMHLLHTTHKFIAPHWNISVTNTVLCGWLKHVLLFYLACGKLQNSCTQQFWLRVMQTLWAHIVASTALKTSRYPWVQRITLDPALSPSVRRHHRLKGISHSAHCGDSLVGLHGYMGYCSSSHTPAWLSPFSPSRLLQVLYWPAHRHGPSVQRPSRERIRVPAQKSGQRGDCLA